MDAYTRFIEGPIPTNHNDKTMRPATIFTGTPMTSIFIWGRFLEITPKASSTRNMQNTMGAAIPKPKPNIPATCFKIPVEAIDALQKWPKGKTSTLYANALKRA